jgi:hypothetical protein
VDVVVDVAAVVVDVAAGADQGGWEDRRRLDLAGSACALRAAIASSIL